MPSRGFHSARRGRVIESLTPFVIVYCCTVMIVAYSVRGASGFGAAAALPLLGLALPLKLLAPAWTVLGTFGSIFFAMYYDAIKLGKDHYRATMTAIMFMLGVSRGIGYWAVGEFTREVLLVAAFLFPSMMVGTLIGMRIHHGMSDLAF